MNLNRATCIRALDARDPRFDGVFFVGVTSTRIYCRPVCPAPPPRRDRCQFFSNAAAAERRGFRPCLRCRPELAPGNAIIDATDRVARAASARIAEGALNGRSVDALAAEFDITARQLRRVIEHQTGVTPVELAQTHRLLLAKRLLTDTVLPMTQVAFASGFQSVRRFDALFQERYRLTPSALRRKTFASDDKPVDTVSLTLGYRAPLDWGALMAFFAARATPGVEDVEGDCYARTVSINGLSGWVRVQPTAMPRRTAQRFSDKRSLRVEIPSSLTPALMPLLAKLRQLFDLDADPAVIEQQLAASGLEHLVRTRPGLRVPGAMDGFDLALRAVLGQQVSVKGATTIAGRFAEKFGDAIATPDPRLCRGAPVASRVASASVADLRALGVTTARAETVRALAEAVASGALRIEPNVDVARTTAQLTALPGIGDWTAQYIAMRALRWPDGFPASDLWLRRAAGGMTTAKLVKASARWQPWRAYAAMHLWSSTQD
ncbi:MAG: helix-turn-helix domain-containing protein [Phycisphaerae bacterium]|nr:helix-turn-helix domain-containing protein [Gemmatimonadaceae bacterium]